MQIITREGTVYTTNNIIISPLNNLLFTDQKLKARIILKINEISEIQTD